MTKIPALLPRGSGAQFVFYGDACSGVPGALHEGTHAAVNRVVAALDPPPEFIAFPGDEIIGLVADDASLRAQWAHWLHHEMAWLAPDIPLYNSTGNHTCWNPMSARVFHDVLHARLPLPDPATLSYLIRHGELALVVIDTLCLAQGGEGYLDLDRLATLLDQAQDAATILVMGHHPAFAVNGFAGPCQRTIAAEQVAPFWALLRRHGVTAYLCSHVLAFDVQVQDGILQITSAGAGTAHRMPEETEYLHAVQMAIDATGLRYQVLDIEGNRREALSWPPTDASHPLTGAWDLSAEACRLTLRGTPPPGHAARQTLATAHAPGRTDPVIWIGLAGPDQHLAILLQPVPGRSPHLWTGPSQAGGHCGDLVLHPQMGPGGLLWRAATGAPWTSLTGHAAWGLERLGPTLSWTIGGGDTPFVGTGLQVTLDSLPLGPI